MSRPAAGSIAFVYFRSDRSNGFAFVSIDGISAGTIICFTDNEWDGSGFNTGEGLLPFVGTHGTTPTTFPAGISNGTESASFGSLTDTGLTVGTTAVLTPPGADATAATARPVVRMLMA